MVELSLVVFCFVFLKIKFLMKTRKTWHGRPMFYMLNMFVLTHGIMSHTFVQSFKIILHVRCQNKSFIETKQWRHGSRIISVEWYIISRYCDIVLVYLAIITGHWTSFSVCDSHCLMVVLWYALLAVSRKYCSLRISSYTWSTYN